MRTHPTQNKPHIEKTGLKEIAWFIALWAGGVLTVSLIGLLIRAVLVP